MAIHRGIQSALFFYLSCAPCAEARYRRKRKEEAARGRIERQLLEAENPNIYRHPSPAGTNPYWQSEIAAGPALAVRGKRKANTAETARVPKTNRLSSSNASGNPSSVNLPAIVLDDDRNDSRWNFRPYQREDEELWGSTSQLDGSMYGDNLTVPPKVFMNDFSSSSSRTFRHPPINGMHPATVTTVNSREEIAWMKQPPPVAGIMSGKERVPRSRSDSGASRMTPSSINLSRQLSNRLVQNKLRPGETSIPMSRESSSRASNGPYGQRHDRSATTSERDFAVIPAPLEAPIPVPEESEESIVSDIQPTSLAYDASNRPQPLRAASRPQLSTIVSDNDLPTNNDPEQQHSPSPEASKENELPTPPLTSSSSFGEAELYLPQPIILGDVKFDSDMAPRNMSGKVFRTSAAGDLQENMLRTTGHKHEESEDTVLSIRPDLFDTWYTPDFELPKWVADYTKREVKHRWSMDL